MGGDRSTDLATTGSKPLKWSLRLFVVGILFLSLFPIPLGGPLALVGAAVLLTRGRPLSLPGPVIVPVAVGASLLAASQIGHVANNFGQAVPTTGLDIGNAVGLSLATAWYARTLRVVAREDLKSDQLSGLWTTTTTVCVAVGVLGLLATVGATASDGLLNSVFGGTAFGYIGLAVGLLWALLTAFTGLATVSAAKPRKG